MATIVIFDDDVRNIARTRALVEQVAPRDAQRIILEASSLARLRDILDEGAHVDILISDVVMPDGEPTGIEVVQRFFPEESGTQVIFASGYLEQALEVYRAPHMYFLLKPLDPDKLGDALGRAYRSLADQRPQMLRIKTGHRERLVAISSITYLESSLHKVTVHCRSASYVTYAKLDDLQQRLPARFSRCHRSIVVNLADVVRLEDGELTLSDGTTLPVSRRRMREVQHDLLSYLSSR